MHCSKKDLSCFDPEIELIPVKKHEKEKGTAGLSMKLSSATRPTIPRHHAK
jgi:hypothetical protein